MLYCRVKIQKNMVEDENVDLNLFFLYIKLGFISRNTNHILVMFAGSGFFLFIYLFLSFKEKVFLYRFLFYNFYI